MSRFFKKNNAEKTRDLFNKKLIYESEILEPEYENLVDFYNAEKYLYGRVNYDYQSIELNTAMAPLATLSTTNTPQTGLQAIKFVVAAFNDLSMQFDKKFLTGEIDTSDQILAKLEVKKAYQDPQGLYNQYAAKILSAIGGIVNKDKIRFKNFEQFMVFFDRVSLDIAKKMPFTYTGFLKSKYCPMNVSGLVIEIADPEYADDEKKIRDFKNSKNWKFYLNACRSYGFLVDSSNPWRLIANIGSEEMIYYARNTSMCRFTSTTDVLMFGYTPAYVSYFPGFKEALYNMYNQLKKTYSIVETCGIQTTAKIIVPEALNYEQFQEKYDDTYFLKRYVTLRLSEEKISLNEQERDRITKETLSISRAKGTTAALSSLEKVIGHTYNESGSLTDLIYRVKISKQEE